jgi:serine/threonine protein kinase
MAPERLTGRYSPASDVFSMAVIVLEMLTGKRLADLRSTFSDATFGEELAEALRGALGGNGAKLLAERLAPAYDSEPRRRPEDVKQWAEEVAAALDQE